MVVNENGFFLRHWEKNIQATIHDAYMYIHWFVFFLHKRERVISLGSRMKCALSFLHHCQIRGSPRSMTFTFYEGVHNKKVKWNYPFLFKWLSSTFFLALYKLKHLTIEQQIGTFVYRSCNFNKPRIGNFFLQIVLLQEY